MWSACKTGWLELQLGGVPYPGAWGAFGAATAGYVQAHLHGRGARGLAGQGNHFAFSGHSMESWKPYVKWEQAHGQGDHPAAEGRCSCVVRGRWTTGIRLQTTWTWWWPLTKEDAGVEELYVVDRAAPAGMVRKLTAEEVWRAQGRTRSEWEEIQSAVGEERLQEKVAEAQAEGRP